MEAINADKTPCEACGEFATIFCMDCYHYYCDECSKHFHEKTLYSDHKLRSIEEDVQLDTRCNSHRKHIMNSFCLDENSEFYL